jgi:hypothetical protein
VPVLVEGAPVGILELSRAARGGWDAGQLALARADAGLLSARELLAEVGPAASEDGRTG